MEPSLPQSHQSSLRTKTKSRGSVSLLSIVWFVVTVFGVASITRATAVVQQRAEVQTYADAIALAAASHGNNIARRFATSLHVQVTSLTHTTNTVTVHVTAHHRSATATAILPL